MENLDYDVIVIGSGVVGLACAYKLSTKKLKVLVVERNSKFGMETSSRNSQVIHAGIYYPTNSQKAIHCVKGSRLLYEWCKNNQIPHQKIGKFIVAVNNEDEIELDKIENQANQNGVIGLERKTKKYILEKEPNLKIYSGLYSKETGIIDSHKLMYSFVAKSEENNVDFIWSHEVISAEKNPNYYTLTMKGPNGEQTLVKTQSVVNSGGLDSDRIASLVGFDLEKLKYKLHYCRGHYFRIKPTKSSLVKHLIYPCPMKNLAGLGIHITVELDGSLRLGPDVQYLNENKQNYEVDPNLQPKFFQGVSQYLNGVTIEDLAPDSSGIRPKLQGKNDPFRDFIITEESKNGYPNWINLIGIESPGLTSCLSIAETVLAWTKE